jgi:hypothetical protein
MPYHECSHLPRLTCHFVSICFRSNRLDLRSHRAHQLLGGSWMRDTITTRLLALHCRVVFVYWHYSSDCSRFCFGSFHQHCAKEGVEFVKIPATETCMNEQKSLKNIWMDGYMKTNKVQRARTKMQ